jgi:hypothetical protein
MFAESRRVRGGLGGEVTKHWLVEMMADLSFYARHNRCIGGDGCRFQSAWRDIEDGMRLESTQADGRRKTEETKDRPTFTTI